jgi:hypothetical protein
MDALLLGAVALAVLGLVVLLVAASARKGRGLGSGETVALDDVW